MSSSKLDETFVSKEQFTPRAGSHHEDEVKSFLSSSQSKRKNAVDVSQIYARLNIDKTISSEAIEWALNCFVRYDASEQKWGEEDSRDVFSGELNMRDMKATLLLGGQKDLTDEKLLVMIRNIGKVDHPNLRVNFKEFAVMCWNAFFKPEEEDENSGDVRDAFEILGGAADGTGVVSIHKLKDFAHKAELTIDIDKFVAEVDDDKSGMVDFNEFSKLFKDVKTDTNLHGSGSYLLRHNSSLEEPDAKKRAPITSLFIVETEEEKEADVHLESHHTQGTGMESSNRSGRRTAESIFQYSFKSDRDSVRTPLAPRTKKVVHQTTHSFGKTFSPNSTKVKCRKGWRFRDYSKNSHHEPGYNEYNVRDENFLKFLEEKIKLRSKGAEFTLSQPSSSKVGVRLTSELRLLKMSKEFTRVRSANTMRTSSSAVSLDRLRPATSAGFSEQFHPSLSPPDSSPTLHSVKSGRLAATSSTRASSNRTIRNYRDPNRPRPWTNNIKIQSETLGTEELLKKASEIGLYQSTGAYLGAGFNYLDDT